MAGRTLGFRYQPGSYFMTIVSFETPVYDRSDNPLSGRFGRALSRCSG